MRPGPSPLALTLLLAAAPLSARAQTVTVPLELTLADTQTFPPTYDSTFDETWYSAQVPCNLAAPVTAVRDDFSDVEVVFELDELAELSPDVNVQVDAFLTSNGDCSVQGGVDSSRRWEASDFVSEPHATSVVNPSYSLLGIPYDGIRVIAAFRHDNPQSIAVDRIVATRPLRGGGELTWTLCGCSFNATTSIAGDTRTTRPEVSLLPPVRWTDHLDAQEEPPGANCPDGGVRLVTGRRSVDVEPPIVELISEPVYVCNSPSVPRLSRTDAEPPGASCPSGGERVSFGPDENLDGELADDEVESSVVLCDEPTRVETVPEPEGEACPSGGVQILTGVDMDGDEALTGDEIESRSVVCNGAGGGCSAVPRSTLPGLMGALLGALGLRRRRARRA